MAIRIEDIKRQQDEKNRQFEPAEERAQAVLLGLDSADSAEVRNRPGFVWYRRAGTTSNAAQALNRRLIPVPGLPVVLQRVRPAGSWEVVDVDAAAISQMDDYKGAYLDRHAREHEPGGNDPLYVYLRMLTPLRTTPQAGLSVNVAPVVFDNAGTLTTFGGHNNYDLSGSEPGSGLARFALVYLDPATNALNVADGDTGPDGGAVTLAFPAVPAGCYPSAYVRLAAGQTEITEADIVDARLLLNGVRNGTGEFLTADGSIDSIGEQDFTAGIKTDTIAESTAAAGVTVDGVLIKDSKVASTYVSLDTTNFTGNLSAADTTVQAALDTLDNLPLGGDVAADTHAAASKAAPVDADELPLVDSSASWALKKLTWANLKATLKTYFDTLYLGLTANASSATKWATGRTITLTGGVTGTSAAFDGTANLSFVTTVGNDTHTHDTRYFTETESDARFLGISAKAADSALLNGQHSSYYQPASTALTTTTNFGGDVSGTYGAIVVADDSHNHIIANVDGLQTALDGKLGTAATAANSDKVDGQHAEEMSWGHDYVHGTFTNFNVFANSQKFGAHFVLGTANGPAHPSATQYYHMRVALGSNFNNYSLQLAIPRFMTNGYWYARFEENGVFGSWFKLNAGNADTATKWAATKTISLTGAVTGTSGGFDGSGDASIATTLTAHTHAIADVTSLQTSLDAKAPLASPTFTGTVTLPATTSIGNVSSAELGYLDGVTSSIQAQFNAALPYFLAFQNTGWNHTAGSYVYQQLTHQTPLIDTNSCWNSGGYYWLVPSNGVYQVNARLTLSSSVFAGDEDTVGVEIYHYATASYYIAGLDTRNVVVTGNWLKINLTVTMKLSTNDRIRFIFASSRAAMGSAFYVTGSGNNAYSGYSIVRMGN